MAYHSIKAEYRLKRAYCFLEKPHCILSCFLLADYVSYYWCTLRRAECEAGKILGVCNPFVNHPFAIHGNARSCAEARGCLIRIK